MASSNPFRKSMGPTTAAAISAPAHTRFPSLDTATASYADPDPSGADQRAKVVKKVRVLSPPPLSPDSPQWSFPTPSIASGLERTRGSDDPFDAASTDDSDREIGYTAAPPPPQDGSRVPANPFSKTLRDMEAAASDEKLEKERRAEGDTLKAANSARRSLDVSSFKRLLMTGNLGADASTTQQPASEIQKGGADSSSISFSSSTDDSSRDRLAASREAQDVSLISRETSDTPDDELDHENISDSSASLQMIKGKKPPPPPSSRHGKSIKLELGSSDRSVDALGLKSPSDVNRPLPPAPIGKSLEIDAESAFDPDAAGKKADGHPTPQTTPDSGKKSGPAPPPRRGHARGESKINFASRESYSITRNFGDETPSRTSSIRSGIDRRLDPHAPVPPPPPRRSHAGSRQSTIIAPDVVAAVNASINDPPALYGLHSEPDKSHAPPTLSVEPNLSRNSQTGNYRVSAPPPPPTRSVSVRRPASLKRVDSNRRASAETKPHSGIAPPPPPRRQRGGSRGSIDGPYRRTSLDGVPRTEQRQIEEGSHAGLDSASAHPGPMSPQSAIDHGKGVDILADLNALQREVDALRGKLGP